MTTEEKLDKLVSIVNTLAETVVHHDNQIDALIKVGERHEEQIQNVQRQVENLVREWQAYLRTLRPQ